MAMEWNGAWTGIELSLAMIILHSVGMEWGIGMQWSLANYCNQGFY